LPSRSTVSLFRDGESPRATRRVTRAQNLLSRGRHRIPCYVGLDYKSSYRLLREAHFRPPSNEGRGRMRVKRAALSAPRTREKSKSSATIVRGASRKTSARALGFAATSRSRSSSFSTNDAAYSLLTRRLDGGRAWPGIDGDGLEPDGARCRLQACERARGEPRLLEHQRACHHPRASIHRALTRLPARDGLRRHAQDVGELARPQSESFAEDAKRSPVDGPVPSDTASNPTLPPLERGRIKVAGAAPFACTERNAQTKLPPRDTLAQPTKVDDDAGSTLGTVSIHDGGLRGLLKTRRALPVLCCTSHARPKLRHRRG
jgi:hypothetical protein